MWPKTTWPSAVAGPVAAKALQCDSSGADRALLGRLAKPPAFEAGRGGLERVFEEVGLDVGVDRDEVEQIERPAVQGRSGRRGSVGDPLHLLEIFGIESAQEQGIGQQPQVLPGVGRRCVLRYRASSPTKRAISGAISRPCW